MESASQAPSKEPAEKAPSVDSTAQAPEPDAASEEAGKRSKLPLIAVILVGLLVGGGVGAFAAGPVLVKKFRGRPAASQVETKPEKAKESKESDQKKILHVIDNLVLNPAGSGGTRFLMLTVTLAVKDSAADEQLKARDAEVRDAVLDRFGRKTVEELVDMSRREAIKQELLAALKPLFPDGTIKAVYFPQFVIQ